MGSCYISYMQALDDSFLVWSAKRKKNRADDTQLHIVRDVRVSFLSAVWYGLLRLLYICMLTVAAVQRTHLAWVLLVQ